MNLILAILFTIVVCVAMVCVTVSSVLEKKWKYASQKQQNFATTDSKAQQLEIILMMCDELSDDVKEKFCEMIIKS